VINLKDTLAFGIGNYNSFKTFANLTYYSKSEGTGSISFSNFEFASKQNSLAQALKTSNLTSLSDINALDTLALHSLIIDFK
jgi:hypothetical protein